jgi:D-arabinose 1-dehydrogenase-like Zn-dependent alcohol dehydrogenase
VIVGNLKNEPVHVLPAAFIIREISLLGSKACSRVDLQDSLRFIERGLVQVQLGGSLRLDEARAAHGLLESGSAGGRVILHP